MKRMVFTSISIAQNTVSKSIMFMNFRASLKTPLHIFEWLMYPLIRLLFPPHWFCVQSLLWKYMPQLEGSLRRYSYSGLNFDITRGRGTCKNLSAITRFLSFEVLFHIFYYYWGDSKTQVF